MNQIVSNVLVAIMGVIVLAGVIYAFWVDKGGTSEGPEKDQKVTENKEAGRPGKDKKN